MPINSFIVTAVLIFLQGKLIHIKYDATAVTTCIVMSYNYLLTNTMPNYVNLPCKKNRISVILMGVFVRFRVSRSSLQVPADFVYLTTGIITLSVEHFAIMSHIL